MKKLICKDETPQLIAYIIIFNNMLFAMSMDIHLPAMPLMVQDLNTTEFKIQLIIILFAIGAIFSRLIWGPLSDSYGRRKILILTISIQIIGQAGCCLAPDINTLIFWRGFQSLGAGVSSVIGTAIIADLFSGGKRARMLGLLEMSFPLGFIIAPILGAFILDWTSDWRMNFFFILLLKLFAVPLSYRYIPETHEMIIPLRISTMFSNYLSFFKNQIFVLYSLMVGMVIGNYMIFVVNAPFVYMTDLGISTTQYAFYQLVPMIFNILFVFVFRRAVLTVGVEKCLNVGIILMLLQAPFFFVTAYHSANLTPSIILAMVCYQSSVVPFLIPVFTSKAIDVFPNAKGVSSSVIGSIRSICMSLGMLFGGSVLGSSIGNIMVSMGIVTLLTAITYFYVTFVLQKK